MIHSVNKNSVDLIFKKDASFCYLIPKYQREYIWSQSEWKALYDDLTENDFGYFIGSIICIDIGSNENNITQYEVVDGQQRLTTLTLFLAALYVKLMEHKSELNEDDEDEPASLRKSLLIKGAPNHLILRPQSQGSNLEDYLQIMHEAREIYKPYTKAKYSGNRKISKCYHYFLERIQSDLDEAGDKRISRLLEIKKHVTQAVLVKIEVSNHSDAFVLFESLNNRGIPLTAIDLMKNLILSQAEKNHLSCDECFDLWQQLLRYLTDDYKTQERFFRFYYNAFKSHLNEPFITKGERKSEPLGNVATKSNLLAIYEKIINRDLSSFLQNIIRCGQIYSQLILASDEETPYTKNLTELFHIEGVSSYVLLLNLFRYQELYQLTEKQLNALIRYLTCYFVRRNLTDFPATNALVRLFMNIIATIEEKELKGEELISFIKHTLLENSSSEQDFIKFLREDIYIDHTYVARFLLSSLAQAHMTKETQVNLWEQSIYRNGQKVYKWTIEHIFPEGEKIPEPWVKMIADGNPEKAAELQRMYVHKLGNLTLTQYNTELSNYSFEKKRDRQDQNHNPIGYRNGLYINRGLSNHDSWTIEDIQTRTEEMIQELLSMFAL